MATFLASPLEILRSVVAGAFVTLTVLAGLFALSFVNPRLYESRAKAAVDSKALVARTPLPFGKVDPFRYDPNDCLILAMLSVGVEPVSPKSPQVEVPTAWRAQNFHEQQFESRKVSEQRGTLRHETCYGLKSVLLHADVKVAPYHRYIHGFTMVAGTLMTVLSFEAATKIIHGIALLLPLIIIVIGLKRGGKRGLSYAGMASAYLLFSGVWCFGWTLALGPAEILLCSLMLIGILRPERGSWFYSFAGASAAALDFLTGLSPSALILVIGMAIIDGHRPRIVLFISAVIAAFAAKALAVAIFYGPNELIDAANTLSRHATATSPSITALLEVLNWDSAPRMVLVILALAKLAYFASPIGWGSMILGAAIVGVAPPILAAFAIYRREWCFVLASAVVPVWVYVFLNHTVVHAIWMQRLPAWVTIIGVGWLISVYAKENRSPELR